jgi:uncharacterized membrane protein YgdD (TMEM256/DUF423 family)
MAAIGALFGLLAVIAAAVGSHVLKSELTGSAAGWFQTAVLFLMWHALVLLILGAYQRIRPALIWRWISVLLVFGVLLFCGSLFALALGASGFVARLAPVGGFALMLGWLLMALAMLRR